MRVKLNIEGTLEVDEVHCVEDGGENSLLITFAASNFCPVRVQMNSSEGVVMTINLLLERGFADLSNLPAHYENVY